MKNPKVIKNKYRFVRDNLDLTLPIIGIDGEGYDDGPLDPSSNSRHHHYNLLLAADESGRSWKLDRDINTQSCLDMILHLPENRLIGGYSFKYDLTKILEDLPAELIWKVNHSPDEVEWKSSTGKIYNIAYMNGKFTVRCGKTVRTVWDFFKFFACSFVKAITDWKVGNEYVEEIQRMKEKRGTFDPSEIKDIEHYCYLECVNLAKLIRKLLDALNEAELDLDGKFFGAGSVGAAVLKKMGGSIENQITTSAIPDNMLYSIGTAFFGGRFEIAKNGKIPYKVYERDISSAYPYQIFLLPCFRHGCGEWKLIHNRQELSNYEYALVRYSLRDKPGKDYGWGPFPYRTKKHTVIFPRRSEGGWIWLREYLAGEKLFDNVKFERAWVWCKSNQCNHPNPFRNIAELYVERCRVGKEGKGKVIKLGYNASYGKMAQCIGNPPFHNWMWAGMITSGCRAQLLELMAMHKDMHNIVMVATDGLYSTEEFNTPEPINTGTGPDILRDDDGNVVNKPLGGWETSPLENGMFICRPGIYFKLEDPKAKKVRSRGINAKDLISKREEVMRHFEQYNGEEPFVFHVTRFYGMKTAVQRKMIGLEFGVSDGDCLYMRRDYYGKWGKSDQIMSFSPLPKRNKDFSLRGLPDIDFSYESEVYSKFKADRQDEIRSLQDFSDMLDEQPNCEATIESMFEVKG
jgi:hypothetical protein